jgi:hypothetical protein
MGNTPFLFGLSIIVQHTVTMSQKRVTNCWNEKKMYDIIYSQKIQVPLLTVHVAVSTQQCVCEQAKHLGTL